MPIIAIESCSIQSDPTQSTPAKKILVEIKQIPSIASPETATAPIASTSAIPVTPPPGPAGQETAATPDVSKTAVPATSPFSPAASASSSAAPASASAQVSSSTDSNKAAGVTSSGSNLVIAADGSAEQNKRKDSAVPRVDDKSTLVFLSYQSSFTARVLQLKRELKERGIQCWMANEDLVGNVQDAIGEALMAASAIIICYSHSYRESIYEYNMLQIM